MNVKQKRWSDIILFPLKILTLCYVWKLHIYVMHITTGKLAAVSNRISSHHIKRSLIGCTVQCAVVTGLNYL